MFNHHFIEMLTQWGWSLFWTNPEGVDVQLDVRRIRVGVNPELCFMEIDAAGQVVAVYSFYNVAFRFVLPEMVQSQTEIDVPE